METDGDATTTTTGKSMSLRPRRSLKPPSWMTSDMVDSSSIEKLTRQNAERPTRTARKRTSPLVKQDEPDESQHAWADLRPPIRLRAVRQPSPAPSHTSSAPSEGLIGRVSTPDDLSDKEDVYDGQPIQVTRQMFQKAAEVALKIHNDRLAKQQRKTKLAVRRVSSSGSGGSQLTGTAAAEDEPARPTPRVITAKSRVLVAQPSNSTASVTDRPLFPVGGRGVRKLIKVATKTAVGLSPRGFRVAVDGHRQNLRVLPPMRSPRQVLPLTPGGGISSRVVLVKSSGAGLKQELDEVKTTAGGTALLSVTPLTGLDESKVKTELPDEMIEDDFVSAATVDAYDSEHINGANLRGNDLAGLSADNVHDGLNGVDGNRGGYASASRSPSGGPPDYDDDGNWSDGVHVAPDGSRSMVRGRNRKGIRLTNGKLSYDMEQCRQDVKNGLERGTLCVKPLANNSSIEAYFFNRVVDIVGMSYGYLQCKHCDGIFPTSSSLHSEHVKTRHADLYRRRLEMERNANPEERTGATAFTGRQAIITPVPLVAARRERSLAEVAAMRAVELDTSIFVPLDSPHLTGQNVRQAKKIPSVANLYAFATFLQSRSTLMSLLVDHGLLRNSQWCHQCKASMRTAADADSPEKVAWRCADETHRQSIRAYSFFSGASTRFGGSSECIGMRRIPLRKLLTFVYMWARECTDDQIATELSVTVFAAEQLSAKCRNLCVEYCDKFAPKIGGENVVIEVDELKISAVSYVVAVDYNKALAMFVRLRPQETPRAMLANHVHHGSKIYVRERSNLLSLLDEPDGNFIFHSVPGHIDSIGFVRRPINPCNFDARLIESIGNFWANVREIYKLCEVNPVQCAPYIAEMVLRQNAFGLDEPVFNHFVRVLRIAQFQAA